LLDWHVSNDRGFALLKPWRGVFAAKDWDALLTRAVIPKLEHALRGELQIDRCADVGVITTGQNSAPLRQVLSWEPLLPARRMVGVLERGFFPHWHQALHAWLTDSNEAACDLEQVTRWYLGWKRLFSEDLLAHEKIRAQINVALDMMNQASSGGGGVSAPAAAWSAARDAKRAGRGAAEANDTKSGAGAGAPDVSRRTGGHDNVEDMDDDSLAQNMSLKEVVEAFAERNDVSFVPKPARRQDGLGVWSFGTVSLTIDSAKQGIKAQMDGRWAPVSLAELLELHKKKARQDSKAF
jgi:hypothetical protein